MFSAFFPLAPLCAWVANMLESRLDGYKLLRDVRRPLPLAHCTTGIGPAWTYDPSVEKPAGKKMVHTILLYLRYAKYMMHSSIIDLFNRFVLFYYLI